MMGNRDNILSQLPLVESKKLFRVSKVVPAMEQQLRGKSNLIASGVVAK